MPDSCCKFSHEVGCGEGKSRLNISEAEKTIYVDGCFKNFNRQIESHNIENIWIDVIVSLFLLLRIIMSCLMARQMREKNNEKKRENLWAIKMTQI